MATKKPTLGRDLSALLGNIQQTGSSSETQTDDSAAELTKSLVSASQKLPIEQLQRGKYQPRQHMDPNALQELADSIKAQGIIQPIVVRQLATKQFEIVAGERRWRAAQIAGLDKVPVVIRELDDQSTMALALIENIQRQDLNPIEEARALERLASEFGLTHSEIARIVGRSRAAVSNHLRLLNLNAEVMLLVEKGQLEMGHARPLLTLPTGDQLKLAQVIVFKGLTVRQAESLVRQQQTKAVDKSEQPLAADLRAFQQNLAECLGAKVAIQHTSKGKGKLVIHYNSLDELDGILTHIK